MPQQQQYQQQQGPPPLPDNWRQLQKRGGAAGPQFMSAAQYFKATGAPEMVSATEKAALVKSYFEYRNQVTKNHQSLTASNANVARGNANTSRAASYGQRLKDQTAGDAAKLEEAKRVNDPLIAKREGDERRAQELQPNKLKIDENEVKLGVEKVKKAKAEIKKLNQQLMRAANIDDPLDGMKKTVEVLRDTADLYRNFLGMEDIEGLFGDPNAPVAEGATRKPAITQDLQSVFDFITGEATKQMEMFAQKSGFPPPSVDDISVQGSGQGVDLYNGVPGQGSPQAGQAGQAGPPVIGQGQGAPAPVDMFQGQQAPVIGQEQQAAPGQPTPQGIPTAEQPIVKTFVDPKTGQQFQYQYDPVGNEWVPLR